MLFCLPALFHSTTEMKTLRPEHSFHRPATWALVLGFACVYLSWGTTYLAIRVGVDRERLPPALFGGTRVFLAGLLLLGFLALRRERLSLSRQDWGRLLWTSLLLFVAGNGLVTLAMQKVPSGVTAVLVASTPLWIGLFEMFWPGGDRLTVRGWFGLLVGLCGVFILLAPKLDDPSAFWGDAGPLLVLVSACSWALGSLVMRHRRVSCPHLTGAAYQMMLGGGCLTLLGVVIGETRQLPSQVTWGAVQSFLYLLIVGSLVGFVAFNWLLGHVPAAKVGTYAYVNPVVAVFVGGFVGGEEIEAGLIASIAVILTGVALVRGGERQQSSEPALESIPEPNPSDGPPVASAPG
jgi:drug/metabolite transporter (DMT)-like permease